MSVCSVISSGGVGVGVVVVDDVDVGGGGGGGGGGNRSIFLLFMLVFGTFAVFFYSQTLYVILYRLLHKHFLPYHSYLHSTETELKDQ